jgi:hypothetical protein
MLNPQDALREYMSLQLAIGFLWPQEIAEAALEYDEELDPAVASRIVETELPNLVRRKLDDQKTWPATTDCDRLDQAFAHLTSAGIIARHNFTCCQNCGFAEIGAEIETEEGNGITPRGFAFYHQQDSEGAAEGYGLCLSYAALGEGEALALAIGHEIVAALTSHGLKSQWDGTLAQRIQVVVDWKRRLDPTAN